MSFFLEGMGVGFYIADPVGVVGVVCMHQALRGGVKLGLAAGFGAATVDMLYSILVAIGATTVQLTLFSYQTPLTFVGGILICGLGIKEFLTPPSPIDHAWHAPKHLLKTFLMTLVLTLSNPATLLDFMSLVAVLKVSLPTYCDQILYVSGAWWGSALWWILLSLVVAHFRKCLSERILQNVNRVAGMMIFGFGLYALSRLF